MGPTSNTPARMGRARSTRPKSSEARLDNLVVTSPSSEPACKKRKYISGSPGIGDQDPDKFGMEVPTEASGTDGYECIVPRLVGRQNAAAGLTPDVFNRRDRSTRANNVLPRSPLSSMRYSSAAQAAAVVQSDGYKPREERAWEEFHPNLDIDVPLRAFSASEVEGQPELGSIASLLSPQSSESCGLNVIEGSGGSDKNPGPIPLGMLGFPQIRIPGTPAGGKRRPGRPPKDPIAFFAAKAAKLGKGIYFGSLNTPNNKNSALNLNSKEKLTLPQPSYRKSNTLARFEDKTLGSAKFFDKSMTSYGYQESRIFIRPKDTLIKVSDTNLDDELDFGLGCKNDIEGKNTSGCGSIGRVEYDMDEQDDKWLDNYNADRKSAGIDIIQREIFEITITKIEKEWHNLEKRIPKPNPKPPQTHRPRSSSAAAVNGEAQAGEEQDSKCAICDDGDCENTNAIVFCDGCDLAVHQECYGVPFIPEGQWLCRKCQLIGRGVPTCIFCPNTDGAFKQTNASKWAHLLCAMWIPEVSLGNHTFMEPVMEVEKVPKTRWKLTCYLCNQRMGACIQCGNKSCYQAFHVTCARRARLFLRMKNHQGMLSVLDGATNMKAFCDKHCPTDWLKENDVAGATRDARAYFKKSMRGRMWADSQASALEMANNYYHTSNENQIDGSHSARIKMELTHGQNKKKSNHPQKPIWKLSSGAPVIPFYVFERVEKSLSRFNFQKRKEYTADICRYWTLKREARRGAALLKRLQLQLETFSSMEITRRNFALMGPAGRPRLERRINFAKTLLKDIENLNDLSENVVKRETMKLDAAKLQVEFVDTVYFPISKLLPPIIDGALRLILKCLRFDTDKIFTNDIIKLQRKGLDRHYTSLIPFAQDLSSVFRCRVNTESVSQPNELGPIPNKNSEVDTKESKKLAKKILNNAIQPQLELAIRAESEISCKPFEDLLGELHKILESVWELESKSVQNEPVITPKDNDQYGAREALEISCISSLLEFQEKKSELDSLGLKNHDDLLATENRVEEQVLLTAPEADQKLEDSLNAEIDATAKDEYKDLQTKSGDERASINSPDSTSYPLLARNSQLTPPTPPVSNDDNGLTQDDTLTCGGIPWIFKDFEVEGTSCLLIKDNGSDGYELSDIDENEAIISECMNGNLDIEFQACSSKNKTNKVKKKVRLRK